MGNVNKRLTLDHLDITDNPTTFISTDYASGTTLTVKNTQGFAASDFILVGKMGAEQAEIAQIDTVASNTSFTLKSALKFPHASDSTVTLMPYNQFRVYRSTTGIGGTYTLITAINLMVDELLNFYLDASAQSTYSYQFSFYNSSSTVESERSDEIPYGGYSDWMLKSIQDAVITLFGDKKQQFIDRDMITLWTNMFLRKIQFYILGSDSPYQVSSVNITSTGAEFYDISAYAVLAIFRIEYSTDGGVTWVQDITPKDLGVMDNGGSVGQYDYRLAGSKIYINPTFVSGYIMRIWYATNPTSLTNQTDVLPDPWKPHTELFINYCLQRAHEKDRKMTEMAAYYRDLVRHEVEDNNGVIKKIKNRIRQGNRMISSTYLDDFRMY